MFPMVEMSRLTVAAPLEAMDDVLAACDHLGCVHVQPYEQFEEGIGVGQAAAQEGRGELLTSVRAVRAATSAVNASGAMPRKQVESLIEGSFPGRIETVMELLRGIDETHASIQTLAEERDVMGRLAPLDLPLELLNGISGLEVLVAETSKASKVRDALGDLAKDCEVLAKDRIVAVACRPAHAPEVQIVLGQLGAKVVQVPPGEGRAGKREAEAKSNILRLEAKITSDQASVDAWVEANGRDLVCVHELLERQENLASAPTQMAVADRAFAMDAWIPTTRADEVKAALKPHASLVEVEAWDGGHHGHDDHDDHGHGHGPEPPVEFDNPSATKPFELMVDLVGRPSYGTYDPTSLMMFTFPMIFGAILGDWGFGLVIVALAMFLRSKPMAADPVVKNGITILLWMGIWCILWGFYFAEGFGFVWDNYTWVTYEFTNGNSPLGFLYPDKPVELLSEDLGALIGMNHLTYPLHRASPGHGLEEYVMFSIYLGVIHLMVGFTIGFLNVLKAHGAAAAFFEKGSWILILIGGFFHARLFIVYEGDLFSLNAYSATVLVGIVCLIIGLAVYEKFGWAGGIIMGPIETFGLLANTLSYLRVMGVGVAGVKIAEVSITMGWEVMMTQFAAGGIGFLWGAIAFLLFLGIQVFAIALGLLSPSIHAARLHFVEWMGKFHNGSGAPFSPVGGRSIHVEGA
ncbi:MAG: V-type ATPase 116kDa subunit family protein [Candidatus Poseidoniaceae archaeon]|jgi:V/A-type H+-transporting ATPase subunit I|nr:V-type ATPase 116kDa subunit family protein [Candidatus Poseidoniaceae archaeon]